MVVIDAKQQLVFIFGFLETGQNSLNLSNVLDKQTMILKKSVFLQISIPPTLKDGNKSNTKYNFSTNTVLLSKWWMMSLSGLEIDLTICLSHILDKCVTISSMR